MAGEERVGAQVPEAVDVLVFSMGDVSCGIDSEHVERVMMLEEVEQEGVKFLWFDQLLSFCGREMVFLNPKVVIIKGREVGLAIEQPRDFTRVPIRSIRPLPPLLEMTGALRAFWGAFVRNDDEIVMLIDPYRLLE